MQSPIRNFDWRSALISQIEMEVEFLVELLYNHLRVGGHWRIPVLEFALRKVEAVVRINQADGKILFEKKLLKKLFAETRLKEIFLNLRKKMSMGRTRASANSAEVRQLGSHFTDRREAAIQSFDEAPVEWKRFAVSFLLDRSIFSGIPLSCFCFSPLILVAGLGIFSFIASKLDYPTWMLWLVFPFATTQFALSLSPAILRFMRDANYRKSLFRILNKAEDKGLVPLFLKNIFSHDLHIESQKPLFKALALKIEEMLPSIQESDLANWSLGEKATLIHALTVRDYRQEAAFGESTRLEVIRLLEIVGKKRSLKVIQELAEGKSNATAALQERAMEALPILIERVNRLENERTLLRASSSPETSDTLLRPVIGGADLHDSKTLLRPTENTSANPAEARIWEKEEKRYGSENSSDETIILNQGRNDSL